MDNNDNKHTEAESLFATRRKKQQEEAAEKAKLEELERQKQQMAAEIARLEQMQAAQAAEEHSTPDRKKILTIGIVGAGAVLLTAVICIVLAKAAGKSSSENIVTETSAVSMTTAVSETSPAETTSEKKTETSAAEHKTEPAETETSETEPSESALSYDGNTFNGHSYEFISEDISWTDARERCYNMGGHLATVSSYEEEAFLEQLSGGTNAWIGAYSDCGAWRWVTNEPFDYENWAPGEPNDYDGEEWCCQFSKNQDMCWNDVGNYNTLDDHDGFICEYDGLTDELYASDTGDYSSYDDYGDYEEYQEYSESTFMQMLNSCEWNTNQSEDGDFIYDFPTFFEYEGDDSFAYIDPSGVTSYCFIDVVPDCFEDPDSSEKGETIKEVLNVISEELLDIPPSDNSLIWYDSETAYIVINTDDYYSLMICSCSESSAVLFNFTISGNDYGNFITDDDILYFYNLIHNSISFGVG